MKNLALFILTLFSVIFIINRASAEIQTVKISAGESSARLRTLSRLPQVQCLAPEATFVEIIRIDAAGDTVVRKATIEKKLALFVKHKNPQAKRLRKRIKTAKAECQLVATEYEVALERNIEDHLPGIYKSNGLTPPVQIYTETFSSYAGASDPVDWFDTGANYSLLHDESNFKVWNISNNVFGTFTTAPNIHSHLVLAGADNWSNYEVTGRMRIDQTQGGIGVTVLSNYPNSDVYYILRRSSDPGAAAFRFDARGTLLSGSPDTGVIPTAGLWYKYRINAEVGASTLLRAKVWRESTSEPQLWQAIATDTSSSRLKKGTIGVWSKGSGGKFWDDFSVRSLNTPIPVPTVLPTVTVTLSATSTATPSPTASPTVTRTATLTATPTRTSQATNTVSRSPTPTSSPSATTTPSPTVTPTISPTAQPQNSPVSMSSASRSSGVAPLAVHFDAFTAASGIVQPASGDFGEFQYTWQFGDPNAGTWMRSTGHDRNEAFGPIAGHVFENSGSYMVNLIVTTPTGQKYTYQQLIQVDDVANTPGWTTYYVSQSGNDANDGRDPSRPFQSFDKVKTLANSKTRILFQRGPNQIWNISSQMDISGTSGIIGAYGNGQNPEIRSNSTQAVFKIWGADWRFLDLKLTGLNPDGVGIDAGSAPSKHLLVDRVFIQGFNIGFVNTYYPVPIVHDHNFIVDSEFKGQINKGIFIGGTRNVILGNYLHDTGSHILRVWHGIKSIISDNLLLDPLDPVGAVIKFHNATEVANLPQGRYDLISANIIRGYLWAVTIGTQGGWANEVVREVIVERNFFLGASSQSISCRVSAQNVLLRNNIGDLTGSLDGSKLFEVTQWGAEPPPTGARIYNNIVYRSDSLTSYLAAITYSDTTLKNNIAWGPANLQCIKSKYSPAANAPLVCTPQIDNLQTNPLWMNPTGADFKLRNGSPAINTGVSVPVLDDFEGRVRDPLTDGPLDFGAYEY